MSRFLFYAMQGEKMCFAHILMNALDLSAAGHEVKIIFEGASVKLAPVLEEEKNALYVKARDKGLIAGVCKACSHVLGVLKAVEATGLPILADMNGHAGMKPFVEQGYVVISM
jgi:hypothetical protein